MNKNIVKNLIVSIASVAFLTGEVYADGQYGEIIKNKNFRIEKEVRIKDEGSFKDKLVLEDDEWDEIIEFRIEIENTGEVETDDMKMEDYLPDELERVGGDGLTEYWDDFEPGETKTFYIDVKIDENEFDRENFEKCVVNVAAVLYDGTTEGENAATVCYGEAEEEIEELPETGFESVLLPVGVGLVGIGALIKKHRK